jgi:hypothetical protein
MSEKWKNISNTDKSVIKAETIFAKKLIGNNSEFRNDICFNNIDISLDEDIIIANVQTVHTHNTIKTLLLKCNVIDLSDDIVDISYIDISSSIYTNASGGFYYLRGEDFSTSDLRTADLSANRIGFHTATNNHIGFETDVSFDNTIKTSDISLNYISPLYDSSIILHSDTIIDGSLNVEKLVIREIDKISTGTNYIEIHGDISTNNHIDAVDISVSNSVKVGRDLSLSKIDSREPNNYLSFNSDISINGMVDASEVTISDISALNGNIIGLTKDLSINGGASIQDISFDGNISPLSVDGCLNVVGDISFSKHIQAKKMTVNSITHHSFPGINDHNDGSGIVFHNDVSIVGIILANNKPKHYRAVVNGNFNDLVMELGTNYGEGALGLLTPAPKLPEGDTVYTDDSLNEFHPDIPDKDISYVSIDHDNPVNKTSLYVQVTKGNVRKLATINDDISYHAIIMTRGADVSNWLEVYDDVSHTFGYNTSEIIGLRNGVFNDDSYNRTHFLDISAFDPEGFDVSHMFYSNYLNTSLNGFDISFVDDGADYRIRVITPSLEVVISDLCFNIVAHDYTNYIIRQVSLVHDKHLKPKEPSWNEIKLRTYDFSHQEIRDTELSWNDLSLNNKISQADTRDVSTAYFDISVNQYFGDNSDNIYYIIDLNAIYNTTDPSFNSNLDLSFNIKINNGDLSRNIELSGSQIIVETSIPNGKTIADYQNEDTSINIIVHNYYDFTNSSDPSFHFDAAGITASQYGYTGYTGDDKTDYNKDISRNIVLKVYDSIINEAPKFTYLEFYGISYGHDWKTEFYNDNSFDSSFYNFNVSNNTNSSLNDPSFTYYIWDTSSIYDNYPLQYRIDLSGLDPEEFNIDISKNITDPSMNFSFTGLPGSKRSLIVTTTGERNTNELDSSLSLFFDDCGNFIDDMCYNKINLTFHPFLYKFKEFVFTNCDASGRGGPSLVDCSHTYTERYNSSEDISSLDYWWVDTSYLNMLSDNSGIQLWTVPATGQYDITIAGAGGGRSHGDEPENTREGYGAVFDTSVILHRGDKYRILIGQRGQLGNTNSDIITGYQDKIQMASSGGGGTFFVKDDDRLNDIDDNLTTANSDPDAVMNEINDISDLFIAVAGGGSGGRTWNDDTIQTTITDASHNNTANSGTYQDENEREDFITVDEYAPGREIGQLTLEDGNVYSAQFPYTGGGGGGGLFRVGGYAGTDICGGSFQAQPFILGGKGGRNTNTRIGIIGNAKEGGFGGGGAGGDGGSGGGGGYAGGGADTHTKIVGDNLSGNNINPDKSSYAGGGSSFVNDTLHSMNMSNGSQNKNPDSNGYLHIKFNPYNTL